jgi:DNA modification methylase
MRYDEFLQRKERIVPDVGHDPEWLPEALMPFQQALVRWACRKGRAALWADTGLGKTIMQLAWIREMAPKRGLIVTPLAVADQTVVEAERLLGMEVLYTKHPIDEDGIWITNYQNVHKFVDWNAEAIVLDESSILASVDGKTRTLLLKEFGSVPYRLCCTATPAPNDVTELANHAEFLGFMTRAEMLAHFFVHDSDFGPGNGGWRLKGHAREAFWRWVAHWAAYVRKPSDLGFDDSGFVLPPLNIRDEIVPVDYRPEGSLFAHMAGGIIGRAEARRASLDARVARAAEIIAASKEQWLVWCGLNDEAAQLTALLAGDAVNIEGKTPDDEKIALDRCWRDGIARVMVTKLSIFGAGMNYQHCHKMMFLGLGDSWQAYYQGIRREWRYGQKHPVDVVIVLSEAETAIAENVRRKEQQNAEIAAGITAAVRETMMDEINADSQNVQPYETGIKSGDGWTMFLGDSVERIAEIETGSVGLSVFSPPFASLYTYSASDRDMGNSKDYDEFFKHFDYLIPELLRVTMPARRACVHVQQTTLTKATNGVIGWRDFRADVVRHFVAAGWIYDGEVVIDKDPQAQAIRTRAKGLAFAQKNKDSAWSRPAMADYILLFRSPGDATEPVKTDVTNEEWILFARPIWYGIRESDTLNASAAREEADEKHICPLQLETIERCVRLWSNPGDVVFDPFAGIGSTGYVSLKFGRRFKGIELKPTYFGQAVRNVAGAVDQNALSFATDEVTA